MAENKTERNLHAVALGRLGGQARVPKGMPTLTAKERKRSLAEVF
jgi:hypothetical protein